MSTPKGSQQLPTPVRGRNVGDSLREDRVLINARRLSPVRVINLTGDHKAQEITARDNVFCVIEAPLTVRPNNYQRS
jgi:hypothetical protein